MNDTSPSILLRMLLNSLVFTLPIAAVPIVVHAKQDVVIIGETAAQRQHFQAYWQQLLHLNQSVEQARFPQQSVPRYATREEMLDNILRNLYVRDLGLDDIVQLNGSSQLSGMLTNENNFPVTVVAVNYEILDRRGDLLQTGSAQPTPRTIAPGQSVTFSEILWTILPRTGYEVRLLDPPFVVNSNFP